MSSALCCNRPECVRSAIVVALRELTYPLIAPVWIDDDPRAPWSRLLKTFAVRWGMS